MPLRWRKRLIFLVLFIALIVILRMTLFKPKPVEVSAFQVQPGLVEETVTNSKAGTVKVRQRANLSTEIGGRVAYLGVREGDRVTKGQLLLHLDDSEHKASLDLATRAYQASLSASQESCVSAQLALREFQRNKELHSQGVVSDAILDQSSNQNEVAQARCEASRADANRARAAVSVSEAALSKTKLFAPFDGTVAQVTTELGEFITPSPPGVPIPPVIDIFDDTSIYVEAPIDETDATKLKLGLPLRISLDPYPNQTFPGKLTRIAPFVRDVEGQNRTVDVEGEFSELTESQKFLPGTSADIEIILNTKSNVLRIPTYALMEGNRVLLIQEKQLVLRNVKTGLRNWDYVEIIDGLKEGDIITVSLERAEVQEGVLVSVKETVQ